MVKIPTITTGQVGISTQPAVAMESPAEAAAPFDAVAGVAAGIGDAIQEEEKKEAAIQGATSAIDFEVAQTEEAESLKDGDVNTYQERLKQSFDTNLARIADELSPDAANVFRAKAMPFRGRALIKGAQYTREAVRQKHIDAASNGLEKLAATAANAPSEMLEILEGFEGNVDALTLSMNPKEAAEFREGGREQIQKSALDGMLEKSPELVSELVEQTDLDQATKSKYLKQAESAFTEKKKREATQIVMNEAKANNAAYSAAFDPSITTNELRRMQELGVISVETHDAALELKNSKKAAVDPAIEAEIDARYLELGIKRKSGKVTGTKASLEDLLEFQDYVVEQFNKGTASQATYKRVIKNMTGGLIKTMDNEEAFFDWTTDEFYERQIASAQSMAKKLGKHETYSSQLMSKAYSLMLADGQDIDGGLDDTSEVNVKGEKKTAGQYADELIQRANDEITGSTYTRLLKDKPNGVASKDGSINYINIAADKGQKSLKKRPNVVVKEFQGKRYLVNLDTKESKEIK